MRFHPTATPPGWEYVFILTSASAPPPRTRSPSTRCATAALGQSPARQRQRSSYRLQRPPAPYHPGRQARQTTLMRCWSSSADSKTAAGQRGYRSRARRLERFICRYTNPWAGDPCSIPFWRRHHLSARLYGTVAAPLASRSTSRREAGHCPVRVLAELDTTRVTSASRGPMNHEIYLCFFEIQRSEYPERIRVKGLWFVFIEDGHH